MPTFTFEAHKTVAIEHQIEASSLKEAHEQFRSQMRGYQIDAINDREFIGCCEGCRLPLFDGDEYTIDHGGELIRLCLKCSPR